MTNDQLKAGNQIQEEIKHIEFVYSDIKVKIGQHSNKPFTLMVGTDCKTPDRFNAGLQKRLSDAILPVLEAEMKELHQKFRDL